MSRIELAAAVGVSKSHVHQLETGQRTRMRLTTLAKYAHVLNVPPSYIDYGYGAERTKMPAREFDLGATLRQATELEEHQIEQVLRLIQGFEGENARGRIYRRAVTAHSSEVGVGHLSR